MLEKLVPTTAGAGLDHDCGAERTIRDWLLQEVGRCRCALQLVVEVDGDPHLGAGRHIVHGDGAVETRRTCSVSGSSRLRSTAVSSPSRHSAGRGAGRRRGLAYRRQSAGRMRWPLQVEGPRWDLERGWSALVIVELARVSRIDRVLIVHQDLEVRDGPGREIIDELEGRVRHRATGPDLGRDDGRRGRVGGRGVAVARRGSAAAVVRTRGVRNGSPCPGRELHRHLVADAACAAERDGTDRPSDVADGRCTAGSCLRGKPRCAVSRVLDRRGGSGGGPGDE